MPKPCWKRLHSLFVQHIDTSTDDVLVMSTSERQVCELRELNLVKLPLISQHYREYRIDSGIKPIVLTS